MPVAKTGWKKPGCVCDDAVSKCGSFRQTWPERVCRDNVSKLLAVAGELCHNVLHLGGLGVAVGSARSGGSLRRLGLAAIGSAIRSSWGLSGRVAQGTEEGVDIDLSRGRSRGRLRVLGWSGNGSNDSLKSGIIDLAYKLGNVGNVGYSGSGRRRLRVASSRVRGTVCALRLLGGMVLLLVSAVGLLTVGSSSGTGGLAAENYFAGSAGI